MSDDIFRKKSLERMKSPEILNDYIRVSNPGIWLLLAAVVVLLAGACIWGVFGHIDTQITVYAEVENGRALCRVRGDSIASVDAGCILKIKDTEGIVTEVGEYDSESDTYIVFANIAADDGFYNAFLVTERIRPLSFVIN